MLLGELERGLERAHRILGARQRQLACAIARPRQRRARVELERLGVGFVGLLVALLLAQHIDQRAAGRNGEVVRGERCIVELRKATDVPDDSLHAFLVASESQLHL